MPREARDERDKHDGDYTVFQVSWGGEHGADARRLLAILCRRGDVKSSEVGAIRIGPTSSTIAVRSESAAHFIENAQKPDPRDPRVRVRPLPTHWDGDLEAERALPADKPDRPARRAPASHPAARTPAGRGGGLGPPRKRF